jgi:hypothetical protein
MFSIISVSDAIQLLILSVLSAQLYFLHKTFISDHDRRSKQSTIEYMSSIREKYRGLSNKLIDKFGENPINLDQLDDITKNDVKELLSTLEHLSVGVNTGVYDFDILNRMTGGYLIKRYHQLLPYITKAQKNSPTFFIEFETLCKRIDEDRKSRFKTNNGNIKF